MKGGPVNHHRHRGRNRRCRRESALSLTRAEFLRENPHGHRIRQRWFGGLRSTCTLAGGVGCPQARSSLGRRRQSPSALAEVGTGALDESLRTKRTGDRPPSDHRLHRHALLFREVSADDFEDSWNEKLPPTDEAKPSESAGSSKPSGGPSPLPPASPVSQAKSGPTPTPAAPLDPKKFANKNDFAC